MGVTTAINNLNKDAAIWQFIGNIKEKQKIEIDLDKEGQTAYLRVSRGVAGDLMQAISRIFARLFDTIAAAEPTITWINSSLIMTRNNLINLAQAIEQQENKADPKILETSLKTLKNLKEQLNQAPLGLENLKRTYDKRVTKEGASIPDLIEGEQKDISNKLLKAISKLIVELGDKLQKAKTQIPVASTAVEAVKKELKTVKEKQDAMIGSSFAVLAEEELGEKVKEYYTDPVKSPVGIQVARELVQGKQNDIKLTTVKTRKGSAKMPSQFSLDLPRMISLKLNGIEIYSRLKTFQYDPVEAYQKLGKALGDENRELIERGVAARVAALMAQSYIADIVKNVSDAINKDSPNYILPIASDQYYEIDVVGDKVRITLKMSFDLVEMQTRKTPEENRGAIIIKREIEIPIQDLLVEDLETREDPLPHVKVTDTYSKRIQSAAYAEELLTVF